MTKQVVWTFRNFFFLQFDTKFASKQQRWAKIGTILWLLLSTQISQVWHTTQRDENVECGVHSLERPLRVSATQWLSSNLFVKDTKSNTKNITKSISIHNDYQSVHFW